MAAGMAIAAGWRGESTVPACIADRRREPRIRTLGSGQASLPTPAHQHTSPSLLSLLDVLALLPVSPCPEFSRHRTTISLLPLLAPGSFDFADGVAAVASIALRVGVPQPTLPDALCESLRLFLWLILDERWEIGGGTRQEIPRGYCIPLG